jgi:hypothetical protein
MLSIDFRSSLLPASCFLPGRWLLLVILTSFLQSVSAAQGDETILIIAPHEDDEVLMVTRTIEEALQKGHTVRVAIVTNGELGGATDVRIAESLAALAVLGIDTSVPSRAEQSEPSVGLIPRSVPVWQKGCLSDLARTPLIIPISTEE